MPHVPLTDYLTHPAIALTLKVTLVALILQLAAGLPLGLYLAGKRSPAKTVVEIITTLPIIFPPMALGFFLLLILGKNGPVGHFFDGGIRLQDNIHALGGARRRFCGGPAFHGEKRAGRSETLSLAIYNAVFEGEFLREAIFSIILTVIAIAALLVLNTVHRKKIPGLGI